MAKDEKPDYKRPAEEAQMTLDHKCRDCAFFREFETWGKPCIQLGLLPSSIPCRRFTPSPSRIRELGLAFMRAIYKALSALPKGVNRDIAASVLILNERNAAHGLSFGEPVYVRVGTGEYLNHYLRGLVTVAAGDQVFVQGISGYTAQVSSDSVLHVGEFAVVRRRLQAEGKILDPSLRKNAAWRQLKIDYTPPDIDGSLFKTLTKKVEADKEREKEAETRNRRGGGMRARGKGAE